MAREFKLPDLGEGVHEGEVLAVHVSPGQRVKEGEIIFEVETDKAAVEIPSPFTGVVAEVLVHAGDTVRVGEPMLRFENGDARAAEEAPPKRSAPDTPRRAEPGSSAPPVNRLDRPVPASPATRRLARELGVDLRQVRPTGRGGVATADDVRAFDKTAKTGAQATLAKAPAGEEKHAAPSPEPGPPPVELPDFSRWGPVEKTPLRSIRKATAIQMATAWSQIPHVSNQDTIDVTRLEAFRRKHKAGIAAKGGRLTATVFMIKAVATALKAFPQFNASLDMARQEIIHKQYYHIGVAVNTDRGLIVPVIRDVDRKSIEELSIELQACVEQTRSGKISLASLQGGTFTITNAGAMGGGFFTPIINYPEVGILGMGQARMQPVVISDDDDTHRIAPRLIMPVVLCFDHRVADGADAVGFLRVVIEALEDPEKLLIAMI